MATVLCRIGVLLALCGLFFAQPGQAEDSGGYATATRAEFVFACMATNG